MKRKNDGGFSLVEVLVSIAILGLITIPMTSGMLTAIKMNTKAQDMMNAQLAVSSAVEKLMAEGISSTADPNLNGVDILIEEVTDSPYYNVTVTSEDDSTVVVETVIRKAGGGA